MLKNKILAKEILQTIDLVTETVKHMNRFLIKKDYLSVETIANELITIVEELKAILIKIEKEIPFALASTRCDNFIYSIKNIIRLVRIRSDRANHKLEYELLTISRGLYEEFYFFACIFGDKYKEDKYYSEEFALADSSDYINNSIEKNDFKYDVTICVVGYNKAEYTKACIESIIKYTPSYINYELIILNNGSSDDTQAYFDSLKCIKEITFLKNIRSNKGLQYIFEGKYILGVSNDVIVTENYLDNLLKCIESDDKIAMVVPTTSNVSNLQNIAAEYANLDEMHNFAKKNNVSNPRLWEERIRLCNPICLYRSELLVSKNGVGVADKVFIYSEFTDDALGLRLRRAGYKLILAKDCYCHHFGSITLKESQIKENTLDKSRDIFIKRYGVDAWSTGFCYDLNLIDSLNLNELDSEINILGINSGFGSNPLKIKSIYNELGNQNVKLYYATDDRRYVEDLKIYSDEIRYCNKNIVKAYNDKAVLFDYILVEDNVLSVFSDKTILKELKVKLANDGYIMVFAKEDKEKHFFMTLKPNNVIEGNNGIWFTWIKSKV